MKFLTEGLAHTSGADVRQASEEVIVKLYKNVGSPVKDYLPPEKVRRNILYKRLVVALDAVDAKSGSKASVCALSLPPIITILSVLVDPPI